MVYDYTSIEYKNMQLFCSQKQPLYSASRETLQLLRLQISCNTGSRTGSWKGTETQREAATIFCSGPK